MDFQYWSCKSWVSVSVLVLDKQVLVLVLVLDEQVLVLVLVLDKQVLNPSLVICVYAIRSPDRNFPINTYLLYGTCSQGFLDAQTRPLTDGQIRMQ